MIKAAGMGYYTQFCQNREREIADCQLPIADLTQVFALKAALVGN